MVADAVFEVVGLDRGDAVRTCLHHPDCCGTSVKVGTKVVFVKATFRGAPSWEVHTISGGQVCYKLSCCWTIGQYPKLTWQPVFPESVSSRIPCEAAHGREGP